MPKGSRGTGKPYLRGSTWWIKYSVTGESKPRCESTNSTNKTDAIRLLNKRRSEIDNRQVTPANVLVSDLLDCIWLTRGSKRGIATSRRKATSAST